MLRSFMFCLRIRAMFQSTTARGQLYYSEAPRARSEQYLPGQQIRIQSQPEKKKGRGMRKSRSLGPAEVDHRKSLSLLRATLESTADGVLVVDNLGKITTYNQQFAEMWRIPPSILSSGSDDDALNHVLEQLKDPERFRAKVSALYAHPGQESF